MAVSNPTNKTTAADESIDNLDDRDIRALVTPMTVMDNCGDVADNPDLFEVTTDSGSCYTVNVRAETCTCPDHEYRGVECKHIRRVKFETGLTAIPADVDGAMLDDQLGAHISDANLRVAATDGGVAAARGQRDSANELGGSLGSKIGFVIGVDGEGDAHCHYPSTAVVKVFSVADDYQIGDRLDSDDVVREQALDGRPLLDWMRYTADKRRGWKTVTHRAPDEFEATNGGDSA